MRITLTINTEPGAPWKWEHLVDSLGYAARRIVLRRGNYAQLRADTDTFSNGDASFTLKIEE